MKATAAVLLVGVLLTTTQCVAQRTVSYSSPQRTVNVQAQSSDISYNLDLQAVASIFGEARNLEDFERRLNDYDAQISNLDLNNDGQVDYLRVIESSERNTHLVVIQAVLDRDVYQDVASIVVERTNYNKTYVQVIGDPYMYGNNYIIEPAYVYTPSIFSFFWGNSYSRWSSPYYWGYYPQYYRYRNPFEVNIYMSNIYRHINHEHNYYYNDRCRSRSYNDMHRTVSRNDYGNRYPDRNFSSRNGNVTNRYYMQSDKDKSSRNIKDRSSNSESSRRGVQSNDYNTPRGTRSQGGVRSNSPERNSGNRSYSPSTTPTRTNDANRGQNSPSVRRPASEGSNSTGTRMNSGTESSRGTYEVPARNSNTESRSPRVEQPSNRSYEAPTRNSSNESRSPRVEQPSNRSYEAPTRNSSNESRSPRVEQPSNRTYEAPARNSSNESRSAPSVSRQSSERSAPAVSQPSRSNESKPAERSNSSDNNSRNAGSRSGNSDSNRR